MGFKPAPSVETIAESLIEEYYPEYMRLGITFRFLLTDKESKAKGRTAAGNARLLTGIAAYLTLYPEGTAPVDFTDDDENRLFLITIWNEAWDTVFQTHHQRTALVHHFLMRCEAFEEEDDKGNTSVKMRIRAPGIEAFPDEIELYGAWNVDIDTFLKAAAKSPQLTFESILDMPKATSVVASPPNVDAGAIPPNVDEEEKLTGTPGPKIPFDEYKGSSLTQNVEAGAGALGARPTSKAG